MKDMRSTAQNSGVTLSAKALHVSSAKDKNHVYVNMSYYEIISDIWEVDYTHFRVVMLKCQWVDNNTSKKSDRKCIRPCKF